jgi:hypothetical protein
MSNPDAKAYLGGFWGNTHHFNGFLYRFEYALLGEPDGGDSLPNIEECDILIEDEQNYTRLEQYECPSRCALT